jgi:hypothetical protein
VVRDLLGGAAAAPIELLRKRDLLRVELKPAAQAGDLQCVSQQTQHAVELGAAGVRAAGVVDVDVLVGDDGTSRRINLVVGVLISV